MSINYCTISQTTVDTFCGDQRAKVLARLIIEAGHGTVQPPAPQPGGGHGTGVRPGTNIPGMGRPPPFRPTYPRERDEPNFKPLPFEQPFITVTAEIMGMRGSERIEVTSRLDFVVITDLEINHEDTITVNIMEMRI